MRATAKVPGSVIGWDDSELTVEIDYRPGSSPTIGGPPESCDPGEPPEVEEIEVSIEADGKSTDVPLGPDDETKVVDWLYENFEFPYDDGDDYDWGLE